MKAIPVDGQIVLLDIPPRLSLEQAEELMQVIWAAIVDLSAIKVPDEE